MRKKLDEARHHFARELHNDQVSIEREKLKRNRRLASGVAAQRQAWAEFEAVDWAARSKKMRLVRPRPPAPRTAATPHARGCAFFRRATYRFRTGRTPCRWGASRRPRSGRRRTARPRCGGTRTSSSRDGRRSSRRATRTGSRSGWPKRRSSWRSRAAGTGELVALLSSCNLSRSKKTARRLFQFSAPSLFSFPLNKQHLHQ